jgi:hypothetical protein
MGAICNSKLFILFYNIHIFKELSLFISCVLLPAPAERYIPARPTGSSGLGTNSSVQE